MNIFKLYGEASGQYLRIEKSRFFVGSVSANRIAALKNLLGLSTGSLPFSYLGVAIFKGKPKSILDTPMSH